MIPAGNLPMIAVAWLETDRDVEASNACQFARGELSRVFRIFVTRAGDVSSEIVSGSSPGSWLWCHVQETKADAGMLGPTTTTVTRKNTHSITMRGRTAVCTVISRGVTTILENRTMDG